MRILEMITNCFDFFLNSLNEIFKEMYGDQFGDYWVLRGK